MEGTYILKGETMSNQKWFLSTLNFIQKLMIINSGIVLILTFLCFYILKLNS